MPSRMLAYRFFLKAYGIKPWEVREMLTEDEYEWLPVIEEADQKASEILRKQEERESKRQARQSRPF